MVHVDVPVASELEPQGTRSSAQEQCRRFHPTWLRTIFPRLKFGMVLTLLALSTLAVGGCATISEALENIERPSVEVESARLTGLGLDHANIEFDLAVRNPYSVALPVLALDYRLTSGDEEFLSGATENEVLIAPRSTKTVPLSVTVPFAGLLATLEQVRPGEIVPYRAALGLTVNTPAISGQMLLVEHEGDLPVPAAPRVEVASMAWESLTLQSARAATTLRITNTNAFPLGLDTLAGGFTLGGMRVAELKVADPASLEPGATEEIVIPVSFSPLRFGAAFLRTLTGSDGLNYEINGEVGVDTPWGNFAWPLEAAGETVFK